MTIVMNAPDRVGRYRITGVIGEGVGGVVYKAFDASLQRVVALKVLQRSFPQDARSAQAFAGRLREQAQTVARLAHPNIVAVHEIDEGSGRPFIAMEHVAGVDLDQWLAADPLPAQPAFLKVMDQLLDALQSAHVAGMRHGDLKPGNVLVTPSGFVKITDFGLARAENRAGVSPGAAPEYHAGRPIDHRVDLYAAGVLLYRMLAGRDPFAGNPSKGDSPTLRAPSTFAEVRRPAEFDAVVAKAMARDPNQRYASAAEFRGALHEATELRLPAHGARMLTLPTPGAAPVTAVAAGAAAKQSEAFAVRQSLTRSAPPSGPAASAVPTLTIAIPESLLAMPSFDPWARPARAESVVSDGAVANDPAGALAPGTPPDDPRYAAFRGRVERDRRANVTSAAVAAKAALHAAASLPPPAPVAPVTTALLKLPPARSAPAPGGLVITAPVAPPRATTGRVLPPGTVAMPGAPRPAASAAPGIPAEALRRVLKVLAVHFGSQAGEVLKRVAGHATTITDLHTLLLAQAGQDVDAKKLAKQLRAIARLPL